MSDLAKRAVACKHWRWMPGMQAFHRNNLSGIRVGNPLRGTVVKRTGREYPDLGDPATIGCLLALVREAWGREEAAAFKSVRGHWVVTLWGDNLVGKGDTEAEALVAALVAAP